MTRLVLVVEKASDWSVYYPSADVVTAMDYLREPVGVDDERTHVINLCRSYKYLGTGYYVSLLAEARGHRVMPSVRTVNDLRRFSLTMKRRLGVSARAQVSRYDFGMDRDRTLIGDRVEVIIELEAQVADPPDVASSGQQQEIPK